MSVGSKILKSVPALFSVHILQYIIPLLVIPFLLRVLGLEKWGQIALLMTFSQLALILLEFGFHISATQAAARMQGDPRSLAELFGTVTAAKLEIAVVGLPLITAAAFFIPHVADDPNLLALAVIATIVQAHDPLWYFLGTEHPNRIAAVTVLARLASVAVMFLFIRGPSDAWMYFLAQAAAWFCVFVYGARQVGRNVGFSLRDVRKGQDAIARGRHIFQLYLGSSSFDHLLPLVLGAMTEPAVVGIFVGADKLARAAAGLLGPFRNALFPRISALMAVSREEAASLFGWAILRVGGLAALGGVILMVAADAIVHRLLGPEASAAAGVLRILSALPLLLILNSIIGVQWMIPCGMEKTLRNVYVAAGLIRLVLAVALSAVAGAAGAAVSVLCGEVLVLLACLVLLHRSRQAPWCLAAKTAAP